MASAEYDLSYLEAAGELLEKYLLANEIYWQLNAVSPPGEPGFPSLTLGAILLSQKRLNSRLLTSLQENRKLKIENTLEQLRSRWHTAWRTKAREEFRARLDLWANFLEDFRRDPDGNFDRYAYEVGRRVMLTLLEQEADQIPATQLKMLAGLDRILEGSLRRGEFVWDSNLAGGFSPQEYPYLYYRLRD